MRDRAHRELARELRRRLIAAAENADATARGLMVAGERDEARWYRGAAQAFRDAANDEIPSAMRATRGR